MSKLEMLLNSLTLVQAQKYDQEQEQITWIEYELCDPNNISRRHAETIEARLLEILG